MMLAAEANQNATFTSISLSGNRVFLAGEAAPPYQVGSGGPKEIVGVGDNRLFGNETLPELFEEHLRGLNAPNSVLARDVVDVVNRSIDANAQLNATLDSETTPFTTEFPGTRLGGQLRAVAQMIAARQTLGVNRQIFFTSMGGFDTHSNQAARLPGLQTEMADAIAAFYQATVELGVDQDVTTFTASDFGRTLTINGDGTDHGWGAHHFVVGGGVSGGRIIGEVPETGVEHTLDAGRGRLIPTTAVDQYASSLGSWFGLSEGELNDALPGRGSFDTADIGLFDGACV
ncbi:MAG: DUF1501 domain-containing protein, partial [Pseudomonadota bacterium]